LGAFDNNMGSFTQFLISEFGFTKKNSQTIINIFSEICEDFITIGSNFDEHTIKQIKELDVQARNYNDKNWKQRLISKKPLYPDNVRACVEAYDNLPDKKDVLKDMIDGLFDDGTDDFITQLLEFLHEGNFLDQEFADLIITGRRNLDIIERRADFSYETQILSGKYD